MISAGTELATQSKAQLPQRYEAAKYALAECDQVDECKDWADKAAALASYAKQSQDTALEKLAMKIRARAIRRAGELLQQIEKGSGGDRKSENFKKGGAPPFEKTRKEAAEEAGFSADQAKQSIRVANVPQEYFDEQVESDNPPTITALAEQGKTPRQVFESSGKTPAQFKAGMHVLGAMRSFLASLDDYDVAAAVSGFTDSERKTALDLISKIQTETKAIQQQL
jgi:hypothetical protein